MTDDAHLIIAGDSNALGYLNTGPAPYTPTARVQIWTDTNGDGVGDAWNYMRPGVNTGTPANPTDWGPEVQQANAWLQAHPTGILWIVKDAETVKGSTTLAGDWNPASGHMFASTTHAVEAAMHNLDGSAYAFTHYDVADVVLGENDAVNHDMAMAYGANLTDFIAHARTDWDVTEFVFSRINDAVGAAADNLAVRQAVYSVDVADDHAASFKTIGFAMQPDDVHYAEAGQVALGQGFFDAGSAFL
jgi:hypothetical protein